MLQKQTQLLIAADKAGSMHNMHIYISTRMFFDNNRTRAIKR